MGLLVVLLFITLSPSAGGGDVGFSGCSLGIPTATLLRCGLEQGAPYKGSGVSSPADRLCQRCSSSQDVLI